MIISLQRSITFLPLHMTEVHVTGMVGQLREKLLMPVLSDFRQPNNNTGGPGLQLIKRKDQMFKFILCIIK